MVIQHQIKRSLDGKLEELRALILARPGATRTAIADELCQRFSFLDGRGRPQRSSCLKALRDLAQAGRIDLPASQRPRPDWKGPSPRRLGAAVPAPRELPRSVAQIENLRLELVETY